MLLLNTKIPRTRNVPTVCRIKKTPFGVRLGGWLLACPQRTADPYLINGRFSLIIKEYINLKISNNLQLNITDCKRSMRVCISSNVVRKKERVKPISKTWNKCKFMLPKTRDFYNRYVNDLIPFCQVNNILLDIQYKMRYRIIKTNMDGEIINNEDNIRRSIRRARVSLVDLAMVNDFQYFGTITINGEWHNIYNPLLIKDRLSKFFNNYKSRTAPDFEYLLVPEYGAKNGRLHFHFLMSGIPENDLFINEYNYLDWLPVRKKFGHVQITKINNSDQDRVNVAKYCAKYMSKDNIQLRSHRYFRSKGLKKAILTIKYFPSIALAARDWLLSNGYIPYAETRYNVSFAVVMEDISRFITFIEWAFSEYKRRCKHVYLLPLPDDTLSPFDTPL